MRLLLDTHILLWAIAGSSLLKPAARRLLAAADQVFVSAASIWEVAINARLGKIKADRAGSRRPLLQAASWSFRCGPHMLLALRGLRCITMTHLTTC